MTEQKKPAERILASIDSEPWLITEVGLAKIREIAARDNLVISADDIQKIDERREALAAKKAARMDGTSAVEKRDGVAIINVAGPIARYMDVFTSISSGTTVESAAMDFNLAMDDRTVDGVLFNFDTPGGQVKGINEFARMIASRRGEKPIGGYIGGDAGSAGYWLAAAVEPGLLGIDASGFAGSIGARVAMTKDKAGPNDRSVTFEFVSKQSPHKDMDPETESGRTELQRRADAIGALFVDSVAELRGVSTEKVLADFGGGRMLMGKEAKDAGLVDRVTSMEEMIQAVKVHGRTNVKATPRFAASTKERAMANRNDADNPEVTALQASFDAAQKRNADLQAQIDAHDAEKKAIEAAAKKTAANAQVDAWASEGRISGSSADAVREVYIAAATGKTVTAEQIANMVSTLPKINSTRIAAAAKGSPSESSVTANDFVLAGNDVAASRRISDEVNHRRKENPKFTYEDLRRELTAR